MMAKRKKSDTRALSIDELHERVIHVFDAVKNNEDMVCAVTVTSFVDGALGALLSGFLVDCETAEKILDARRGALGSLQARIDVAYSLGLLTKPCKTSLDAIAEMRNKFAHALDYRSFNHPEIAKLCQSLQEPKMASILKTKEAPDYSREDLYGTPRARFETVAGTICMTLLIAARKAERRQRLESDGAYY
jgi:hypothetical protein